MRSCSSGSGRWARSATTSGVRHRQAEKIAADCEGGVLKVRVPLQEKAQPREVEVNAVDKGELAA